jgi:hypothetical protein
MDLLIYSGQEDRDERELLQATGCHDVRVVRTPGDLIRHGPPSGGHQAGIVILLVSTLGELERFVEARECLSGTSVILILPDEESALNSLGFRLRASYTGYRGGPFADVQAVIARLQQRRGGAEKGGGQAAEGRL